MLKELRKALLKKYDIVIEDVSYLDNTHQRSGFLAGLRSALEITNTIIVFEEQEKDRELEMHFSDNLSEL